MEAVDDDGGVGEARLDNGVHRLAEVHRHFLHLPALGQGYHHQDPRYDIGLGALDHGDQRPLPAMAVLVGEYRVDVVTNRGLVYRVVFADVVRQQYPIGGVPLLVPLLKIAQALLVVALKRAALDMEETGDRGARDGEVIQDRL